MESCGYPFRCWNWNITVSRGQYHHWWCPESLRRQYTTNHSLDCVGLTIFIHPADGFPHISHHSDVITGAMASWLFTPRFIQAQIKENMKAPRHWPLCGEFTGDRLIPRTNGQWRGKCFHWMTSSCQAMQCRAMIENYENQWKRSQTYLIYF